MIGTSPNGARQSPATTSVQASRSCHHLHTAAQHATAAAGTRAPGRRIQREATEMRPPAFSFLPSFSALLEFLREQCTRHCVREEFAAGSREVDLRLLFSLLSFRLCSPEVTATSLHPPRLCPSLQQSRDSCTIPRDSDEREREREREREKEREKEREGE